MTRGQFLPALLLVLPLPAAAGEIYGKVSFAGQAVAAGVEVAARCGDTSYPAVKTDAAGSYSLVVAATGRCTLTVTREGASASVTVASYEDAAQADIALAVEDGQLVARRR